ncbi:plexin-C1 [Synchiropus splendidus]|uniref:plexin-C1 n=1 Tax=Synchiropus splendidus TaxID=270530 RepID=UPI00237EB2D8|nr:plexin-C1 [Synchiropus splendidus]
MSKLLALSFVLLVTGGGSSMVDETFTLDGDVRHLVVGNSSLYIATDESLYQLNHDLALAQRRTLTGVNGTLTVQVLLPFVRNRTLVSCGVTERVCGYCEVLDLNNINSLIHKENVLVGPMRGGSSVNLLVDVKAPSSARVTYILTALKHVKDQPEVRGCLPDANVVFLYDTIQERRREIFSKADFGTNTVFSSKHDVEFVDGFQMNSTVYLLSNVFPKMKGKRGGKEEERGVKVRLVWMQAQEHKRDTMRSARGATFEYPWNETRLIASSVVPSSDPVLWAGVFSRDGGPTSTELVLFDITPDFSGDDNCDPDFKTTGSCNSELPKDPLSAKKVLYRKNHMTAVLATRVRTWMVFFIGTGDGQLTKLSVDSNFQTTCPTVLYHTSNDRKVFPKMHIDDTDGKHLYAAFKNQVKRVLMSKCSAMTRLEDCWSAQDPTCVWCGPEQRCMFEGECQSEDWISYAESYQKKVVSYRLVEQSMGQIALKVQAHITAGREVRGGFACQFSGRSGVLCRDGLPQSFPGCTCVLSSSKLPIKSTDVLLKMKLGRSTHQERVTLQNCTEIKGPRTSALCLQCVSVGCSWTGNGCSWHSDIGNVQVSDCLSVESGTSSSMPNITSVTPKTVSFYGKNHALLSGQNLSQVTKGRIQFELDCTPREFAVLNRTETNLVFHIPPADQKGVVNICVVLPDDSCHGSAEVTYVSAPTCSSVMPNSSWISGKRNITLSGSYLDMVDGIVHSVTPQEIKFPLASTHQNLSYETPAVKEAATVSVSLRVANQTLACPRNIIYYPDPVFTSFTSTEKGDDLSITIQKKADHLEMTTAELSVWGVLNGEEYPCVMISGGTSDNTDFFTCEIRNTVKVFKEIKIMYGETTVTLESPSSMFLVILLVLLLPIVIIFIVVVIVYKRQQKKLTVQMNQRMEVLEMDIRNDIRQGFVDLQTERADLIQNVGAIPFFDYKHFASRIFFPENEALMASCIADIGQNGSSQNLDESCQGLLQLIQDPLFLTSMVHALEEQKSFTIRDKCTVASLLTVALHSKLTYLTKVMEVLLKDLMQQNSNTQPKLLLRRTESIVEKLLSNWMSICLYGFLRENVGQHLFLMVSALTQQISKGPVDCVTEKALYTLSEDWLLWQAQDFSALKLKVLFPVGSDGEVSEPLEVNALDCDAVDQVKEKILSSFKTKFGFSYSTLLRDLSIEFDRDGSFVALEEVDASSEVIGEVTMLNTLRHYKVPDGATIKVLPRSKSTLRPQGSVKDDQNFSGKYFHLIDPDVDESQTNNPERKKLKVKEVHLTKLLSTKVAVHSFVENLFRSIWGHTHGRAHQAVKYFFDFLDTQADNMKITDPDVLHIWKTNSLPLRFWINIMKNPQFVFDMEKTSHLDGCLSVIAQAFMDSFSLSEMQLGKHAPTNKLLYARDIPVFKQEVKTFYKQIRDLPPMADAEFNNFLREESEKHEEEFNKAAVLTELLKFIMRYFSEIKEKLDQNGAPAEMKEHLADIKNTFGGVKSRAWS